VDKETIHAHWQNWAQTYGDSLRATTKNASIKALEIDALRRGISNSQLSDKSALRILEVGCGNGFNCLSLAASFPEAQFTGVDFVPEMIAVANEKLAHEVAEKDRARFRFLQGDVLQLDQHNELAAQYDVVFTDRCLINLPSHQLQDDGLQQLCAKVRPGGLLLLIENQTNTHGNQNRLREALGMPARKAAEFNLFMDQGRLIATVQNQGFALHSVDHFASLHDILLYVLVPFLNAGQVDYDAPIVHAATELLLRAQGDTPQGFGEFGQNPLFIFSRNA
jgi:SAM-dependent methyltransferase